MILNESRMQKINKSKLCHLIGFALVLLDINYNFTSNSKVATIVEFKQNLRVWHELEFDGIFHSNR